LTIGSEDHCAHAQEVQAIANNAAAEMRKSFFIDFPWESGSSLGTEPQAAYYLRNAASIKEFRA
jgi:hypothetical protein